MLITSSPHLKNETLLWCQKFGFIWCDVPPESTHLLWDGKILYWITPEFKKPFYVDFSEGSIKRRIDNWQHEALIKAVGKKPFDTICDATAGFGEDAMILSKLKKNLVLVERNPVIAALLENGVMRYQGKESSLTEAESVTLFFEASEKHLETNHYDVIYIDPMFQGVLHKAKVKKKAQVLRELASDEAPERLLNAALRAAKKRVIVKRAKHAPPLIAPHHCIDAGVVRFDVYEV